MFQSGLPFFASMRDQMRVERAHEQRVAEDRDAAVVRAAADARVGRAACSGTARTRGPFSRRRAITSFGRWVTYMMPSTTIGLDCQAPNTSSWQHPLRFEVRRRWPA